MTQQIETPSGSELDHSVSEEEKHAGWLSAVWSSRKRSHRSDRGDIDVDRRYLWQHQHHAVSRQRTEHQRHPQGHFLLAPLWHRPIWTRRLFGLALQGLGVSLEIAALAVLIAGVIGTLGGIVAGVPRELAVGDHYALHRHDVRHSRNSLCARNRHRTRIEHSRQCHCNWRGLDSDLPCASYAARCSRCVKRTSCELGECWAFRELDSSFATSCPTSPASSRCRRASLWRGRLLPKRD